MSHGWLSLALFAIWSLAIAATAWQATKRAQKSAREEQRRRELDEIRQHVQEAFKEARSRAASHS